MELVRAHVVSEGYYALIAPNADVAGVNTLVADIDHLRFAVGALDSERGVGFLANLLHPNEAHQLIEHTDPINRLGVKRLTFLTAGLDDIRGWRIFALGFSIKFGRNSAVVGFIEKLRNEGIEIPDKAQDIEQVSRWVALDLERGLYIPNAAQFASFELNLSSFQPQKDETRGGEALPAAQIVKCSYKPVAFP